MSWSRIRTLWSIVPAAAAGAASWTVAEYGLHRFAMHEMNGRGLASVEHLKHHADVRYFAPASKKALSAAATTSVVLPVSWGLVGRRKAIAFTTGMISMYYGYEILHRRIHTHAPRNEYGRRIRLNHLHHHFGGPRRNYGVTVISWDRAFGTDDGPTRVIMPRRMAPDWLLDENNEVKPEFVAEYEVRGRARASRADVARDRDDAFSNRPPDLDGADEPSSKSVDVEDVRQPVTA